MENQVLNKLVDSFEDFKERLIRIEENVKDIKTVKTDVDNLKITVTQNDASTKSAHKRLDAMEANQTWLWRTVIAAIITGTITGAIGIFFYFIKLKGGA